MYLCLIWYPSLTSGLLSRVATVIEIYDRKGEYINLKNWFNQFSIASHISVNENQSVKGNKIDFCCGVLGTFYKTNPLWTSTYLLT